MGQVADIFNNALFAETPVILTRRLLPFSLAHNAALKAMDSPLLYYNREVAAQDLVTAVYICTLPIEGIRRVFAEEFDADRIEQWAEGLTDPDYPAALEMFRGYLEHYCNVPDHWQASGAKGLKHPWEWIIVVRLCQNRIAANTDEAWNMAVNLAACYTSAIGETEGNRSLVSDGDLTPRPMVPDSKEYQALFGAGGKDGAK